MTRKEGQQLITGYGAAAVAVASAAFYGMTVWLEQPQNTASDLAIVAGVAAGLKMLIDRNRKDTQESVSNTLTWEAMLAGMGLKERFDKMERHIDDRHAENAQKLASLMQFYHDNINHHAQHIAVTDSHAKAIGALGEAVTELKPDFVLPELYERK